MTTCRVCGRPIKFVQSKSGKWIPVDVDERGNVKTYGTFVSSLRSSGMPVYHKCPQTNSEKLAQLQMQLDAALADAANPENAWWDGSQNIAELRAKIAELR